MINEKMFKLKFTSNDENCQARGGRSTLVCVLTGKDKVWMGVYEELKIRLLKLDLVFGTPNQIQK